MKKLLVLFVSFVLLAIPCFAGDLQYNTEVKIYKTKLASGSKDLTAYNSDTLILEDYDTYKSGGDSIYGYYLNTRDEYNRSSNDIDKKYIDILIKKYNDRVIGAKTHTFKAGVISIPDNEYSKLSDSIKKHICFWNYFLAQDI